MSNMLFLCRYFKNFSIFYKMKIPIVLVLNKDDIADTDKLKNWIKDYDAF